MLGSRAVLAEFELGLDPHGSDFEGDDVALHAIAIFIAERIPLLGIGGVKLSDKVLKYLPGRRFVGEDSCLTVNMDSCIVPCGHAFADLVKRGRDISVRTVKNYQGLMCLFLADHLPMWIGFRDVPRRVI